MAISTQPSETPEEREKRQDAELEAVEYATGIKQVPGFENPKPSEPTSQPGDSQTLQIKTVTASPDDGNKPENVIDSDITNRFASQGLGSFIKLDLGAVQQIDRIDFEWYEKPPRSYNVDVIFEGGMVGGSTGPKTFNHMTSDAAKTSLVVPSIPASSVTVKLVNTSNPKKWLSIISIKLFGKELNQGPLSPIVTPEPDPTKPPIVTPTPTTAGTTKSGIKLMATPKAGGFYWELDLTKDPNQDSHFDTEGDKCTAGTDGSNVKFYNMKGHKVSYASGNPPGITNRLGIYFDGGKGQKQTHTWKNQTGFLWKQGDPKNYIVISTIRPHNSLASNIHHEGSIKNRGGIHSSLNSAAASTIELTHEMKGSSPRYAREYNHPSYDYKPVTEAGPNAKDLGMVADTWFMRQLISRVLDDGTGVSYEYWINNKPFNADGSVNNDNWQLYSKVTDKDGFNSGQYSIAAKWSAFVTTARTDGFKDIDIGPHAFIEI